METRNEATTGLGNFFSLQVLVIIAWVAAVNSITLSADFVYDDILQIVKNPWVTDVKYLLDIFTSEATHADAGQITNYYRPLMNLSYLADYYLFGGLKPWGFHLVNLLLHAGVAVMVFVIASRLLPKDQAPSAASVFSLPLLAALLFALHPANSEVVAWVACVPELSFTLFCLLAFRMHMKSGASFDRYHFWSVGLFSLALFCKETAVILLPLLVVYDLAVARVSFDLPRLLRRYLPFVLPVVGYLLARVNALGGMAPANRHLELDTFQVLINTVPLFSDYLGTLLLPVNLSAFHVFHPVLSLADGKFLLSALGGTGFVVAGILSYRKDRRIFLGLAMIALPLLPVLYIRGLGTNTFADRYLYFPSIGFALAVCCLIARYRESLQRRKVPYALLVSALLGAYSLATIQRNTIWHDDLSLWSATVQASPDSSLVHFYYGTALFGKGHLDDAARELQLSIAMDPSLPDAYINLGVIRYQKKDLDGALREYQSALSIKLTSLSALINMGAVYLAKGDVMSAISTFQGVVRLNPQSFDGHFNLALALATKGDLDAAIQECDVALRLSPNSPQVLQILDYALKGKRGRSSTGA